ncbi:unnamed protein product, partial [marine sediment metagenome]
MVVCTEKVPRPPCKCTTINTKQVECYNDCEPHYRQDCYDKDKCCDDCVMVGNGHPGSCGPICPSDGMIYIDRFSQTWFVFWDYTWIPTNPQGPIGPPGATGPQGTAGPTGPSEADDFQFFVETRAVIDGPPVFGPFTITNGETVAFVGDNLN